MSRPAPELWRPEPPSPSVPTNAGAGAGRAMPPLSLKTPGQGNKRLTFKQRAVLKCQAKLSGARLPTQRGETDQTLSLAACPDRFHAALRVLQRS